MLENAAQTLASAGALVDYDARPAFTLEKAAGTFFALLQAALAGGVSLDRIEAYATATGATPAANTRRLVAMRHRQWLSYNERRLQMRKRWEEFFTDWDAVLLPVMPCAAIHGSFRAPGQQEGLGGRRAAALLESGHVDGSGGRLLSAGDGGSGRLKNGLPVGIQIVGAYLEDRTTLDLAGRLLAALGGCPRPPGF